MRKFVLFLSILTIIADLWGTTYLLHLVKPDDWIVFPTVVTGFIVAIVSWMGIGWGSNQL